MQSAVQNQQKDKDDKDESAPSANCNAGHNVMIQASELPCRISRGVVFAGGEHLVVGNLDV